MKHLAHAEKIIDAIWADVVDGGPEPDDEERAAILSYAYPPLIFAEDEAILLHDLAGAALGEQCSRPNCHCHDMAESIEDFLAGYIEFRLSHMAMKAPPSEAGEEA